MKRTIVICLVICQTWPLALTAADDPNVTLSTLETRIAELRGSLGAIDRLTQELTNEAQQQREEAKNATGTDERSTAEDLAARAEMEAEGLEFQHNKLAAELDKMEASLRMLKDQLGRH